MNEYQEEHFDTFLTIQRYLAAASGPQREQLLEMAAGYLDFRKRTAAFLDAHFSETCTRKCYENRLSTCCSREGIIAFFADAVINALITPEDGIDEILGVLRQPNTGYKCIYLGTGGCRWRMKPIVCEMFICDPARESVFKDNNSLREEWEALESEKKLFTWPDRPVLFDDIEQWFMDAGHDSPSMYLHKSPGLLRVKQQSRERRENENG